MRILSLFIVVPLSFLLLGASSRPPRWQRRTASSVSSSSSQTKKAPIQRALRRQKRLEWKSRASGSRSSLSSSADATGTFRYQDYTEGVLGQGRPVLLYFYAPWSRNAQGYDKILKAWNDERLFVIPLYRVDFDSATVLREKYGVHAVNSFLLVDGKGKKDTYYRTLYEAGAKDLLYTSR